MFDLRRKKQTKADYRFEKTSSNSVHRYFSRISWAFAVHVAANCYCLISSSDHLKFCLPPCLICRMLHQLQHDWLKTLAITNHNRDVKKSHLNAATGLKFARIRPCKHHCNRDMSRNARIGENGRNGN